ncbi:MAG TPA: ATP-binding cassette domain-containing protein [Vicinamibacterales bacterium]
MPIAITLDVTLRQGSFVLDVHEHLETDVLALVGHSGAGKTSVIEAIAGLRTPDAGEIRVGDRVLFSSARAIDLRARERRIGYVPQDALLFPHLDVRHNILYGVRKGEGLALDRVLAMLEIGALVDRRIDRLSGGERQRVAIARALMASPSLLLLDEPFAGLDPSLRERILPYLRRVRDDLGIPMICVSHEPALVEALADHVLALDRGRAVFSGPPGRASV